MAEHNLSGYWNGLAVSNKVQTAVHIYLDQRGDQLVGNFHADDPGKFPGSGDLHGSVEQDRVTLRSRDSEHFRGQIVGREVAFLMFGLIYPKDQTEPAGTLTLYKQDVKDVPTLMYGT